MPLYRTAMNGVEGWESDSPPTLIAADGIIVPHAKRITHHAFLGVVVLAEQLNAPAQADDGKLMSFWSEAIAAHVLTSPVIGFNGKGALGTATWAGLAAGESLLCIAHAGNWWVLEATGVVIA